MSPVEDYISRLERELRRRGQDDPRILAEAREHLVDAVEEGRRRGLSVDEAEQDALERFGAPAVVAAHVHEERDQMTGVKGAMVTVWRRKWWILVPTVVAAIATGLASYYLMPTRYRADVKILVVEPLVPTDSVQSPVVVTTKDGDLKRTIELLLSRTKLERIIKDFGLYKDELERAPLSEVVERMRRDIDVKLLSPTSSVFSVSFASSDPETAKQVTELLASLFIDENLHRRTRLAETTSDFFESQISDMRERIVKYEATLEDLRAQRGNRLSQADLLPYEVMKERYRTLLVRSEEARGASNLGRRQIGEEFRILDAARRPETPDGPGRLRVTLIGALVGLLIGLALVVLRRSSNGAPPALAEA